MENISQRIVELEAQEKSMSEEEITKLRKILEENLYDRYWCRVHDIDYVNPNIVEAKIKTYDEVFGKK